MSTKPTKTATPAVPPAGSDVPSEANGDRVLARKRTFVPICPKHPGHQHTRVYTTKGRKRYCVCDDCGETFTITGDFALELAAFCDMLLQSLEAATPVPAPEGTGEPVYIFDESAMKAIITGLRSNLGR